MLRLNHTKYDCSRLEDMELSILTLALTEFPFQPMCLVITFHPWIKPLIIQFSHTVEFRLADLYHVILSYDKTSFLMSLSWCNSWAINSTHHGHYTMASADSKFDDLSVFLCVVYSI